MKHLYEKAQIKSSVPNNPPMGLLTIATPLLEEGHIVKLLDCNFITDNIYHNALKEIKRFNPDFIGISFTTPLFSQAAKLADLIKQYRRSIIIITGGPHTSALPSETLRNSKINIAVIGEGDFTLQEIVDGKKLDTIKGIAYKKNKKIHFTKPREYLKNLDVLPFPSFELIDVNNYYFPHTVCRKNPVAPLETSRGCIYGCVYCNKSIFGRTFRTKTPQRVLSDIKKIIELGFKEITIIDDGFTTDIERAKKICQLIITNDLKIEINCLNGIRANRIDKELLLLMKKAGFYRVSFGVESGSQKILDTIKKDITKEVLKKAFRLCKEVGIETVGYFMFGLPGEEEKDMEETIQFAKELSPDIAKFDIMIPLPKTPIFEEWKNSQIKSFNWDDYSFYTNTKVYDHPNLEWSVIENYLKRSYREYYFSPKIIFKKFINGIKNKTLFQDVKLALKVNW